MRILPEDRMHRILLLGFLLLLGLSCIAPPFPFDFALQHVLTAVALTALVVCERRFGISRVSYACLIAFFTLHVIGARYLYSNVPYDDWFDAVFGTNPSTLFGWKRNHYDRLVHLLYGVLITIPATRFCRRVLGIAARPAVVIAILYIVATGSLYEIAEWGIAMLFDPVEAERYNGQQGDMWDPQKDTAVAAAGSLASALVLWLRAPVGPDPPPG